ncbi:MAG: hypothetical protein A3K19_19400 [Lentisphaerae bacterium RIFOXYB12_FULL_65_16]|nr:MAG: hypothetical protein A3K18_31415 [Lentisphaerae bacterium RIFOXYA12_64_32]OGV92028.1 MAG: hypothetical protein A3K19_19400 [Lentisphaerae bacterium RIFOXYB12_FULL_65_16]
MDKSDTIIRFLGIVVLASSSIAAFCVSLMGYTFATGELPFGMNPLFAAKDEGHVPQPPGVKSTEAKTPRREGEAFAAKLYDEIAAEKERLAAEREKIAEQRRVLDEMAATTAKLQQEVEKKIEMVQKLFITIDAQQKENASRVATVIASADSKDGAKMLLQMEEKAAAQVIFYLPPKLTGPLFAVMLKDSDPENAKKAGRILEVVRRLSEKGSS